MWTGRRLGNGEKTDKGEEDSAERSHSAQIRAEGRAGSNSFYFEIPFETECVKNSKLGAAPATDTHTDRKEAGTRQVETENPRDLRGRFQSRLPLPRGKVWCVGHGLRVCTVLA